jgi:hypothetical protein
MSADSWDWSELGASQAFAVSHPRRDTAPPRHARPTPADTSDRRTTIRHRRRCLPATLGLMKAVTCTNAKLEVIDQPTPVPAKGQLLIDVVRCGICGSDLHPATTATKSPT